MRSIAKTLESVSYNIVASRERLFNTAVFRPWLAEFYKRQRTNFIHNTVPNSVLNTHCTSRIFKGAGRKSI